MKLRFLAAAGAADVRGELASQLAHGHRRRLVEGPCTGSISLWVEAGTPLLRNKAGTSVAVGLLFDASANRRLTSLPDWEGLDRACLRDFWGAYVLFSDKSGAHSVLRDPSGAIPVYHGAGRELELFASDVDMLRPAWP